MKLVGLFLAVLAYALLVTPGMATGDDAATKQKPKPKITINEADIYLGDPHDFKKPAVVDVDAVYAKIPEYRKILDREMDQSNPRYLFLLRAASDRFRTALDAAADAGGYDLIGGLGSIKIEGKTIPNITSKVIAKLPK